MSTIDAIVYNLFVPGMMIGFLSPFVAIPAAVGFYVRHRKRIEPDRRVPVAVYVLALIISGVLAGYAGMVGGMMLACPKTGNLCGLFGVFATGPTSFSLALFMVGLALFAVRPKTGSGGP
jgi:hypothetical protein